MSVVDRSVADMSVVSMQDLHLPIAIRRCRRSTPSIIVKSEPTTDVTDVAAATIVPEIPPKTPAKKKRAVRFSDPGPSSSSLTPMMRQTSFATPRRRRSATPLLRSCNPPLAPISARKSRVDSASSSAGPLHRTIDGRVDRQVRRHGFRSLFHKAEEKANKLLRGSRAEVDRLKKELMAKDAELKELQNATEGAPTEINEDRTYDWTLAARDPFARDGFYDMDLDGEHFGDETQAQMQMGTPSRARESFPTPPATSPVLPGTPCSRLRRRHESPTSKAHHSAVQVYLPDPETDALEEEITSLQLEASKLTTTLESYKAFQKRLADRIAASKKESSSMDVDNPSLDHVEKQALRMLEDMAERTTALEHLSSSIGELGFPGKNAQEMLTSLTSGFRAARLELEYLTPGEITLPLTSHGAEVLDLLLTRLRDLAKRVKEDETAIDEYHELEQSLRKQLDGRVTAMDQLKTEMDQVQRVYLAAERRIHELEIANQRLKGAVDIYARDMKELEQLVQQTDQAKTDAVKEHQEERQKDLEAMEAKDGTIADLEDKLQESVRQAERLLRDMSDEQDRHVRRVVSLNKTHGAGLALRDARVLELRVEIDRINESLRGSYETIRLLRVENGSVRTQMQAQQEKAKAAMDAMKEELQRVLRMSQELLQQQHSAPKRKRASSEEATARGDGEGVGDGKERPARLLSGEQARRASNSKKKRRRPDSGLGLLDEEECEMF